MSEGNTRDDVDLILKKIDLMLKENKHQEVTIILNKIRDKLEAPVMKEECKTRRCRYELPDPWKEQEYYYCKKCNKKRKENTCSHKRDVQWICPVCKIGKAVTYRKDHLFRCKKIRELGIQVIDRKKTSDKNDEDKQDKQDEEDEEDEQEEEQITPPAKKPRSSSLEINFDSAPSSSPVDAEKGEVEYHDSIEHASASPPLDSSQTEDDLVNPQYPIGLSSINFDTDEEHTLYNQDTLRDTD